MGISYTIPRQEQAESARRSANLGASLPPGLPSLREGTPHLTMGRPNPGGSDSLTGTGAAANRLVITLRSAFRWLHGLAAIHFISPLTGGPNGPKPSHSADQSPNRPRPRAVPDMTLTQYPAHGNPPFCPGMGWG